MKLCNVPDLRPVGYVTHPDVNGGQPLPLFEPVAPEGHHSINTLEGWNALANKANGKVFASVFGRMPADTAELSAWVASDFNEDFQWEGAKQ